MSWLWEIMGKLELVPKGFPPPDEVVKVLEDFNVSILYHRPGIPCAKELGN